MILFNTGLAINGGSVFILVDLTDILSGRINFLYYYWTVYILVQNYFFSFSKTMENTLA